MVLAGKIASWTFWAALACVCAPLQAAPPALEDAFAPSWIGKPLSALSQRYGQPRQDPTSGWVYTINGCQVEVSTMAAGPKRGNIRSIAMDLSQGCSVRLYRVLEQELNLSGATFGQLQSRLDDGAISADCLRLCGNAYDPSVHQTWALDALDNPMELRASVKLVDGPALDASDVWEDGIEEGEGEDYLIDGAYNCDRRYQSLGRLAFRDVPITRIELGYVSAPECAAN